MMKISVVLIGALLLAGCNQPVAPTKVMAMSTLSMKVPGKGHDHSHDVGPHQGTIFDFGTYHAEFTVDHKKQEVTVYILLGSDQDTPAPVTADKLDLTIKEPAFTVELKPMPDAKDPAGKSSRFVGKHEKFGKEQEFAGTVAGVVDGKPASGDFKEEDEHDHKNEKTEKNEKNQKK